MSYDTEVQRALFSALSPLGLTVYDVAPQKTDGGDGGAFPFVTVGTLAFSQWDTKGKNGFDFSSRIHIRSRSGSKRETMDIQGQIYDRLHLGELDLTNYSLVLLQFEDSHVTRVADGSFHGISEFRGMIEEA